MSHLHHLEYRRVCRSMLRHRGGPHKNTQTHSNIPLKLHRISRTHAHTHTPTYTHRFMCSLLTVIPAYTSHLCSCLCCMLGGVRPCMCVCVCTRGVLPRKESLISGWREPKTLFFFWSHTTNTSVVFGKMRRALGRGRGGWHKGLERGRHDYRVHALDQQTTETPCKINFYNCIIVIIRVWLSKAIEMFIIFYWFMILLSTRAKLFIFYF